MWQKNNNKNSKSQQRAQGTSPQAEEKAAQWFDKTQRTAE